MIAHAILTTLLAASQFFDADAVAAAEHFIEAVKLPAPSGKPDIRHFSGMTDVRWTDYDVAFEGSDRWPTNFSFQKRIEDIDANRNRTHKHRFADASSARIYAARFSMALHFSKGYFVDRFKFGTSTGDFDISWLDGAPKVNGKSLPGLNTVRAIFDMQDGALKTYIRTRHVGYSKPVVGITSSEAEAIAKKRRPSYFSVNEFGTAAKPSKIEMVWDKYRPATTPQPIDGAKVSPFDWKGLARITYRIWFGHDYIAVDAETGLVVAVGIFK